MSYEIIKKIEMDKEGVVFVGMDSNNVRPQCFELSPFGYINNKKTKEEKIEALNYLLNSEAMNGGIKWRGGRRATKEIIKTLGGIVKTLVEIKTTYGKTTREQQWELEELVNGIIIKNEDTSQLNNEELNKFLEDFKAKYFKEKNIIVETISSNTWRNGLPWEYTTLTQEYVYK